MFLAWINNCVGHRNQLFFMQFLLFSVLGCIHATIILTLCVWNTIAIVMLKVLFKKFFSFIGIQNFWVKASHFLSTPFIYFWLPFWL